MEEKSFLVITSDSKVQITPGFHCCARFDEIFHRIPIMTIMLHNWGAGTSDQTTTDQQTTDQTTSDQMTTDQETTDQQTTDQ